MKYQRLLAAFALLGVCAVSVSRVQGQERPSWGPAVWFPNGIFIRTGIGTVPSGGAGAVVSNTSVATTPHDGVFRRILKLSDSRAIIYEIAVERLDDGTKFQVILRSWTPTAEEAQQMDIDPARLERNFLSHYSAPLTVSDGDMLALDVLVNPRTKVKLVDYFRITGRPPTSEPSSENWSAKARPIEVGDVEFFVQNFDLRLNGELIHHSKGGVGGRFVWLDIPKTGRFIFSMTPISEADGFYRTAYVTRQRMIFHDGADKYELTSAHPIIPASGVYYLWVRLDRTFTFPISNPFGNGDFGRGAADHLTLISPKE